MRGLGSIMGALRLIVARGRITRTYGTTVPRSMQLRLLSGEVADRVHHAQHYGFASRPAEGSEAIVVCVGGDRSHPVTVGTIDRRSVGPDLEEGDVVVFSSSGDRILLPAAGGVQILGDVTVEGSLQVSGDVSDAAGTLASLRGTYNGHTHPETDSVTGPPNQTVAE